MLSSEGRKEGMGVAYRKKNNNTKSRYKRVMKGWISGQPSSYTRLSQGRIPGLESDQFLYRHTDMSLTMTQAVLDK